MINDYNFVKRRALKSNAPIKYSILAYVIYNQGKTPREISRALRLKFSTVRTYLNILFHEAEVNRHKHYYDDKDQYHKSKEFLYIIEQEFNEQPSIMSGLFMTAKEYKEFKESDTFKEWWSIYTEEDKERIRKIIK